MMRWIILVLLSLNQAAVLAKELSEAAILTQQTDQQICIDQRLPECEQKCSSEFSNSIHCQGLCKFNISNECRDAGE
jgi:hypothetical protein